MIKCTRCKYKHIIAEKIETSVDKHGISHKVCPRCNCRTYVIISDTMPNNAFAGDFGGAGKFSGVSVSADAALPRR